MANRKDGCHKFSDKSVFEQTSQTTVRELKNGQTIHS